MTEKDAPPALETLTAEQVTGLLSAGQAVQLSDSSEFRLYEEQQQKALRFFLRNRKGREVLAKAPRMVQRALVEELVGWLDQPHEAEAIPEVQSGKSGGMWSIAEATIKNFGGLQPFCSEAGDDAEPLELDLGASVTVLQGQNGAGKSSLVRAICFGLTGKVPRSNAPPEHWSEVTNQYVFPAGSGAKEEDASEEAGCIDDDEVEADAPAVSLPTIVPMPTVEQWAARSAKSAAIQPSVVLTFQNEDGERVSFERVVVVPMSGGKPKEFWLLDGQPCSEPLATHLGIPELALELSAVHLARLPFIRLGEPDDLARRLADLTGFAPLQALGTVTVPKIVKAVRTTQKRSAEKTMDGRAADFSAKGRELGEIFADEAADVRPSVPRQPEKKDRGASCEADLKALEEALDEREAKLWERVAAVADVGEKRPKPKDVRDDMVRFLESLTPEKLLSGEAGRLVMALQGLSEDDLEAVDAAVESAERRLATYLRHHEQKELFVRQQLYKRVADWMKAQEWDERPEACPVCLRSLDGAADEAMGRDVRDALADAAQASDDLMRDLAQFQDSLIKDIAASLPESVFALKQLLRHGEREKVPAVLHGEIVGQLKALGKAVPTFSPAIEAAAVQWNETEQRLAVRLDDISVDVPDRPDLQMLRDALRRLKSYRQIKQWWAGTEDWQKAFRACFGISLSCHEQIEPPAQSLKWRIHMLRVALDENAPVELARDKLLALKTLKGQWDAERIFLEKAMAAASVLQSLVALGGVVAAQINGLVVALNDKSMKHAESLYRLGIRHAPAIGEFVVGEDVLEMDAVYEGVQGRAHEITNASRQRAYLFAFVLALTEHVWASKGGIRLLLLDDPQQLFDDPNQGRLAQVIARKLPSAGFRPVVSTFAETFAASIARGGRTDPEACPDRKVARWSVHARASAYESAVVKAHADLLWLRREEWRAAPTDPDKIKDYCGLARPYVEKSLYQMVGYSARPLTDGAGLRHVSERLAQLSRLPRTPFSHDTIKQLIALMPWDDNDENQFLREALNWGHHLKADDLTEDHAAAIDGFLERLEPLIGDAFEILWHADPAMLAKAKVPLAEVHRLPDATSPAVSLRVVGEVAAADGRYPDGPVSEEKVLNVVADSLRGFRVGRSVAELPAPIMPGSIVLTDNEPVTSAKKGIFGVAWNRVRNEGRVGWIRWRDEMQCIIVSDGGGSPSIVPSVDADVYSLRGVIIDGRSQTPANPIEVAELDEILKPAVAVEVAVGQSAEPLISEGDILLVGPLSDDREALRRRADTIVVAEVDGVGAMVKRVGVSHVPGCIVLLPIGATGDGDVVALTDEAPQGIGRLTNIVEVYGFFKEFK